ncbi:MAG: glycosyltransferase family 1 protein [Planctomycetota bacterium]|nr:MAG: glycosyltransferase family 1 protein [Planctomycetota bacterium]
MSGRAPRVLVLGSVLAQPLGGVRRHNAELLPRAAHLLAQRGGELTVLAPRGGLPFELPPQARVELAQLWPGSPAARAAAEAIAVRGLRARGLRFDLVHTAHLPVPPLPCAYTLTVHDARQRQRSAFARAALRRALRHAARVITVSAAVRDELARALAVPAARFALVPNAADHLRYLPRTPAATAPILCVAHLEPRKNQQVLLRALALDRALPDVWLVGAAKGDERSRLERLARELGVDARVRFVEPVSDDELARLYAACACVALPSTLEGYGIPVAEALAAGAPVAIARIPALVEVARVAGPGAAHEFEPRDAADCLRALRAAMAQRTCAPPARPGWDASAAALVDAWSAAML